MGPALRELSVSAAKALSEIKKKQEGFWLIKLPLSDRQLVSLLNSPAERELAIMQDEQGKRYLFVSLGSGEVG